MSPEIGGPSDSCELIQSDLQLSVRLDRAACLYYGDRPLDRSRSKSKPRNCRDDTARS